MKFNWRKKAAAVFAGLALAVPLAAVSSTPAQAHGCTHSDHYQWISDHGHYHLWDFVDSHYRSGYGWYHHWTEYYPSGGSWYYNRTVYDCAYH